MRYLYVLIVMAAMAFVAAGSAMGQGSKNNDKSNPPSTSCPKHYSWDNSKGACAPPPCQKHYGWDNSKEACEPPTCKTGYSWSDKDGQCDHNHN